MNVEKIKNEELANELLSGDWTGHAKDLTDEAARRLRNSIPKPVVEVEERDGNYDVRINGELFEWYDSNSWGGEHYAKQSAELKRYQLRKALGLEGGGDEG